MLGRAPAETTLGGMWEVHLGWEKGPTRPSVGGWLWTNVTGDALRPVNRLPWPLLEAGLREGKPTAGRTALLLPWGLRRVPPVSPLGAALGCPARGTHCMLQAGLAPASFGLWEACTPSLSPLGCHRLSGCPGSQLCRQMCPPPGSLPRAGLPESREKWCVVWAGLQPPGGTGRKGWELGLAGEGLSSHSAEQGRAPRAARGWAWGLSGRRAQTDHSMSVPAPLLPGGAGLLPGLPPAPPSWGD